MLAHELTHALLWSLAPRVVPTWLNGGLTVVFEGENMDWADERLRETRQRFPLADLHGSFSTLTTTQAAVAYAESGLAVQALLDLIGGVGVTNLLTDLSDPRASTLTRPSSGERSHRTRSFRRNLRRGDERAFRRRDGPAGYSFLTGYSF